MRKVLVLFVLMLCLIPVAVSGETVNLVGSEWSGWWYLMNKPYGTVTSSFFEVGGKISGTVVFTNATTLGSNPMSVKNLIVSGDQLTFEAEGNGGTAKFVLKFKKNGKVLDGSILYRGTDYPMEMKRTK